MSRARNIGVNTPSLAGWLLAGLAVSAPLAAAASACDDDFSAPALGSAWTFFDADNEAGGSARIKGGALELAGKGSDVYKDVNEYVGVKRAAAAGDFDVSVEIASQTPTNPWAQAGIMAANDVGDISKGGYVIVDVTPGRGYHAFYDAAGSVGTLDQQVGAGVSGYPVWIRLTRAGNKFSAYYKRQAGAAWLPIAEKFTTQGTGSVSQLALISLSHNDTATATTVFDDFSCGGVTGLASSQRARAGGIAPAFPWPRFDAAGRPLGIRARAVRFGR